jgi:hypothetical protein
MTLDEVRPYQGVVAEVRTQDPVRGGGMRVEGRIEIIDEETVHVIGQPRISGLSLGDAAPIALLIANIVEITPSR